MAEDATSLYERGKEFINAKNKDTLDTLPIWVEDISRIAGGIPFVFIANKSDLENKEFGITELNNLAAGYESPQFITSAKTGENVEMAFNALGELLLSSP